MDRFQYLFNQYVNKTATSAERIEFQHMLQTEAYDDQLKNLLDFYFSDFEAKNEDGLLFASGDKLLKNILSSSHSKINRLRKPMIKKLWLSIAATAAVFLLIGSITFYFYKETSTKRTAPILVSNADISSGTSGATLTLASGKKIRLTEAKSGKLASEAGVNITKTDNGEIVYETKDVISKGDEINTLSTGKGETFQLRLPDGSLVWLNSASSLTYKASLNYQGKREVLLNGEAYFEVAKHKSHPFIVKTNNQEIKVLGTHFNVMAYNDESYIKTTLLEGSVSIISKKLKVLLMPGEQAVNSIDENKINVIGVDTDEAIAWKNGYFNFDSKEIEEIMKQVGRWYNVEVEFQNVDHKKKYWITNYPRSGSLKGLLKNIELAGGPNFKIEGRKVIVTK